MKSSLSSFSFIDPVFLILRNPCLNQSYKDFLMFSFKNFIVLGFTCRSLIHFELSVVNGAGMDQSSFFANGHPVLYGIQCCVFIK